MAGNFRLTAVLHALICLLNRNTVAWYPVSLIFLPFWAHLIISMKLCRFSFFWKFVFLPVPVFLVSQWLFRSRSLVGQRWCLTWCPVIFVWLQCDMRWSACWIATLWHDTQSVWFSFPFWALLVISMKFCWFWFICLVCPFSSLIFLVSQWDFRSRSLVGKRCYLTWCPVISVWLHCDMRPSACWMATQWQDTQSVWFSFHFELIY